MKITQADDGSVTITPEVGDSEELREIALVDLPQWLELFALKNTEYQDGIGTAFTLGERGQFSDMYRKIMKLKVAMWDGKEEALKSEGVVEILKDLIGHAFLALYMRRSGRRRVHGEILSHEEREIKEDRYIGADGEKTFIYRPSDFHGEVEPDWIFEYLYGLSDEDLKKINWHRNGGRVQPLT